VTTDRRPPGDLDRDEHAPLVEATAAYVLGALDPAERARLEDHLARCPSCRDQVAELAPLPGLLSGVDPDDVELDAPPSIVAGAMSAIGAERRRDALRLRAWRTAAVAGVLTAVAAVGITVSDRPGPDGAAPPAADTSTPTVAADTSTPTAAADTSTAGPTAVALRTSVELVAPAGSAAPGARATLRLNAKGWGTEVEMESRDLPPRPSYTLWVVGHDGTRQPAATWGPTPSGKARCTGATSIAPDRMATVEVADGTEVLLRGSL
jgi:hypothetical protein